MPWPPLVIASGPRVERRDPSLWRGSLPVEYVGIDGVERKVSERQGWDERVSDGQANQPLLFPPFAVDTEMQVSW